MPASFWTLWNRLSMIGGPCREAGSSITAIEAANTSLSDTLSAWRRPASNLRWAVSATLKLETKARGSQNCSGRAAYYPDRLGCSPVALTAAGRPPLVAQLQPDLIVDLQPLVDRSISRSYTSTALRATDDQVKRRRLVRVCTPANSIGAQPYGRSKGRAWPKRGRLV